ncbi:hypothetical protein BDW75DRAFT_211627 [Aspergillus navahoensis]
MAYTSSPGSQWCMGLARQGWLMIANSRCNCFAIPYLHLLGLVSVLNPNDGFQRLLRIYFKRSAELEVEETTTPATYGFHIPQK